MTATTQTLAVEPKCADCSHGTLAHNAIGGACAKCDCGHFRPEAVTETPRHDTPLEHLDETVVHGGAHWVAEGPRGALHVIRWSLKTGNVAAWRFPGNTRVIHRGRAASIEGARAEALRMAGLIADGKKG